MSLQNPTSTDLQTPVLFLVFNRPDPTRQVFEAIREAKPPRLYIAADGPRPDKPGEVLKVDEVRKIATAVDWPCEVRTLFRENNLGCKNAVSSAITWFFEHEEQGIILEDDCLPSQSFFPYCEAMLDRYKNDKKIWMINGFNPRHPGESTSNAFFSQNPAVWGWASWKDRWELYDVNMRDWPMDKMKFINTVPNYVSSILINSIENVKNGMIDTWDYQLTYLVLKNEGLVVKPYANLITNIGIEGTHAKVKDKNHFVPLGEFKITENLQCKIDFEEDLWFYRTRLQEDKSLLRFFKKILHKIKHNFK